jgi:hypothetical protein
MSITVTIEDVVARIKLSIERSNRDLIVFPFDAGNIRRFLESAETTLIMVEEARRKCLAESREKSDPIYLEGLDDAMNGRPSTYDERLIRELASPEFQSGDVGETRHGGIPHSDDSRCGSGIQSVVFA